MSSDIFRKLLYSQLLRQTWTDDGVISLRVKKVFPSVAELGHAAYVVFHIIEIVSGKIVGELSLRIGEDATLFYLGHIGYHIDPPYQGHRYASRACALSLPLFRKLGMRSAVITTDVDNIASIRTCELLGCVLECTVNVPLWCAEKFEISRKKLRYILWTV